GRPPRRLRAAARPAAAGRGGRRDRGLHRAPPARRRRVRDEAALHPPGIPRPGTRPPPGRGGHHRGALDGLRSHAARHAPDDGRGDRAVHAARAHRHRALPGESRARDALSGVVAHREGGMKLPIYQVDAFTGTVFKGNPAAICPLERWLPEATMQSIAAENNLAETAFFVPRANGGADGADYDLRWFTPEVEMDLCGHATLASAFLVFTQLEPKRGAVTFHTRSGPLTVSRDGERLKLDFPSRPPAPCEAPAGLAEALGGAPREVLQSRDLLAVFGTETEVRALAPSFDRIRALGVHAVIATAPGSGEVDFVSRFFAPSVGVP